MLSLSSTLLLLPESTGCDLIKSSGFGTSLLFPTASRKPLIIIINLRFGFSSVRKKCQDATAVLRLMRVKWLAWDKTVVKGITCYYIEQFLIP